MAAERPDIAILVYDLRGSGVVRNVLRIAAQAAATGLATQIWVVRAEGSLGLQVPDNVRLIALDSPLALLGRTAGSVGAIKRIAAMIGTSQPRLLLSAGNQMHVFAAMAWHRARRLPDMRFIGRASNAVIDLPSYRHGLRGLGCRLVGRIERFQYRAMDHVVAVSRELGDDLVGALGLPACRVTVIPNGVDLARIAAEAGVDAPVPPGPLILSVGRLSRQKNFALLIDAYAKMRVTHDARLVVLGDGPPDQRRALLRRVDHHGLVLGTDVHLPGFVANPFAWLARADLFVLSSRWEGSSNALIEALACGCPVVATHIPTGVREVLADGQYGVLVPPDDADAMARAMAEQLPLGRDAAVRKRQRARARDFALDHTLAAYTDLLRHQLDLTRP